MGRDAEQRGVHVDTTEHFSTYYCFSRVIDFFNYVDLQLIFTLL